MHFSVLAAQFPVSLSVEQNLAQIHKVINMAEVGDIVVFPEGSVSGYSTDLSFLNQIVPSEIAVGLDSIRAEAVKRKTHVWVGACYQDNGHWFNAAWGFTPDNETFIYRKVNLATHERGLFTPGADLPIFKIRIWESEVLIGVQLCREIRFPEQWGWLARKGAAVILHLNNAVGNAQEQTVWRSHLVSRAAETQRFVISVNNAGAEQKCPTMAISPIGQVMGELISEQSGLIRVEIDLTRFELVFESMSDGCGRN